MGKPLRLLSSGIKNLLFDSEHEVTFLLKLGKVVIKLGAGLVFKIPVVILICN